MTEPILGGLGLKMVGGAVGGTLVMSILMPKSRKEWVARIASTFGCPFLFADLVHRVSGFPAGDEYGIAIAGALGGFGYFVLGLGARFFEKRNGKDALDVFKEIKGGTETKP